MEPLAHLDHVKALMDQDPFLRAGVVSAYDYIHFRASRSANSALIEWTIAETIRRPFRAN